MKVLIGMPALSSIPTKTVASLMLMNKPKDSRTTIVSNSLVYDARNSLCQEAVKDGFDYLLFIDSDMTFPPDVIERLVNVNADIATGVCYGRRFPHGPVVYKDVKPRTLFHDSSAEPFTEIPDGIFEVKACGMAMCLIKVDVVKALCKHYRNTPFEPSKNMGEDLTFCYRARKMGFKIMADSSFEVGHIGEAVYTRKDYAR